MTDPSAPATVPLLPCPFCGAVPIVHENDWCNPPMHIVLCLNGDCCRERETPAEAIAAWNRRAPIETAGSNSDAAEAAKRIMDALDAKRGRALPIAFRDDETAKIVGTIIESAGTVARALLATPVLSNWRDIKTAPKDGTAVRVRGEMLVHHMPGAKFATMPKDWRPETPHTEWHLTEWQDVPSPPAEQTQAVDTRGEGN